MRLFESQEQAGRYRLVIKDTSTAMDFSTGLTVADSDILVLVRSVKGKQTQTQFSFLVGTAGDASLVKRFNEVMSDALSLSGTQAIATGQTIDIRVFTSADAEEIGGFLHRKGIPFIQRQFAVQ